MRSAYSTKVTLLFLAVCALSTGVDARIHRDHKAVAEFKRMTPCPATGRIQKKCSGWVVDHVRPLACARSPEELRQLDRPENMQFQTVAEGKKKDKWERKACGK